MRWRRARHLALPATVSFLLAVVGGLYDGWRPAVAALLLGPVLACSRLGVRGTLTVVGWSAVLALSAGAVRHLTDTSPFLVEYLLLLAGGAVTVRIAREKTARAAALQYATEVAQVAQGAIMRPMAARVGGIDVCTRHHCPLEPATVGGDVYDVVNTPYGTRVFIGDVRGHDLDAVQTAASVLAGFRDLAYVTPELTDIAVRLDALLAPELGPENFVTALFAEFAPGEVRIVNCGHPPPLRTGRSPRLLGPVEPALPLGLGTRPGSRRCWLQPGDRVLFYTDGLTEARDAEGAEFPLLEQCARSLSAVLPGDALNALYDAVTAHTGAPLLDDVALVLCQQAEVVGDVVDEAQAAGDAAQAAGEHARENRMDADLGPR
ncbi:serine/threonine-protein phosphatase [Streptomyces kunmingensis]|uniref:Serine/threonine-protein phosphatase n=1 Tax=Streptomyces kunmingensis TaxID=68225 RepID=A0ABU6CII9_9ACTN|nr:PP2C family protein-serine/threonine phosphatase [Streptomyces kunmingensis]MEB3964523.1 serine/threonine-protein phosphatase [Streptomyces kunmingensis]